MVTVRLTGYWNFGDVRNVKLKPGGSVESAPFGILITVIDGLAGDSEAI
jgi:hypothetical protein